MSTRNRMPNRRGAESFELEVDGLRYIATVGCFSDGTPARDCGIVLSIALQHGADLETIQRALCRDSQSRASGPLGAALDVIMGVPLHE
jgi:hypothetical protein